MSHWVGIIDGGGTKTRGALVSSDGETRLTTIHPGSNIHDTDNWAAALSGVLAEMNDARMIVVGLAGYGEDPTCDEEFHRFFAGRGDIRFMNDVELAYHGAYPTGERGALLLCGTGSMAMACGPRGLVRAGGWGHVIGDEGSAYWIGRAALATASREFDGREPSSGFAEALCAHLDIPEGVQFGLIGWVARQAHERSAIAGLARFVDGQAAQGNGPARRILVRAADHLVELVGTAARKASLDPSPAWTGAGSTLRSEVLLDLLRARIGTPIACNQNPIGGALHFAARLAGWSPTESWVLDMRTSLKATLAGQQT